MSDATQTKTEVNDGAGGRAEPLVRWGDACAGIIGGDRMEITGAAYLARAAALIEEELNKEATNTALVEFLGHAVRLWREHAASLCRPL